MASLAEIASLLDSKLLAQLGPIQNGLQTLQGSIGAQFQAVNRQLATLTKEQERLAHEQVRQARETEAKFAKIAEEMSGLHEASPHGSSTDGRASRRAHGGRLPVRQQHNTHEHLVAAAWHATVSPRG